MTTAVAACWEVQGCGGGKLEIEKYNTEDDEPEYDWKKNLKQKKISIQYEDCGRLEEEGG